MDNFEANPIGQPGQMSSPSRHVPAEKASTQARKRLVRLAYRFLWNWHDAEDAVHDALVTAEQKSDQLKDTGKWWSWVSRIVVQQCQLHRRKSKKRKDQQAALPDTLAASGPAPSAVFENSELGEILRQLVAELPERQRTAIVLRHLEDMDYPSIARIMEITESTVRVHVRAARQALRKAMLKRYPEWNGTSG